MSAAAGSSGERAAPAAVGSEGHDDGAVLLIDIGNTRLKWCVHHTVHASALDPAVQPGHFPSAAYASPEVDALLTRLAQSIGSSVRCVRVSRVGPEAWIPVLHAFARTHGLAIEWVRSPSRRGPLENGYADPASLGVDRFLGALAVAHSFSGRPAVIVSAGTATTVDALDPRGRFLGGYILPGAALMASGLHRNTAQLPQVQLQWADIPVTTEQAIASGIVQAQSGAVHGMLTVMRRLTPEEPLLVLTGGAREWLRVSFPHAVECDHLVLKGLAWWGRE